MAAITFPTDADFSANYDAAHARARTIFEMVEPAGDWRGPIDEWIDCVDFPAVRDAVMFFTATEARVVGHRCIVENPGREPARGVVSYRVVAEGYRAGPAGP